MPKVSSFDGMDVVIYVDHDPPHVHVYCAEFEAKIDIQSRRIRDDDGIPRAKLRFLLNWMTIHEGDLLEAWNVVQSGGKPRRISGP